MTEGEIAFLALTVCAFATFAVFLIYASWVAPGQRRTDAKTRDASGQRANSSAGTQTRRAA